MRMCTHHDKPFESSPPVRSRVLSSESASATVRLIGFSQRNVLAGLRCFDGPGHVEMNLGVDVNGLQLIVLQEFVVRGRRAFGMPSCLCCRRAFCQVPGSDRLSLRDTRPSCIGRDDTFVTGDIRDTQNSPFDFLLSGSLQLRSAGSQKSVSLGDCEYISQC